MTRTALRLFFGAVLMTMCAGLFVVQAQHARTLDDDQARIKEMSAQVATAEQVAAQSEDTTITEALGLSRERVADDTRLIEDFMRTAMRWDSGATYEAARAALIRRHHLDAGSQFVTEFMAPARYSADGSGRRFYVIDAEGVTSEPAAVEVSLAGVKGTTYSYVVVADLEVGSNLVSGSAAARQVLALFETSPAGPGNPGGAASSDTAGIESVTAFMASAASRHSG